MAVSPLSLSDFVDISVTVAPTAATANSFNQGLFIGPSTVIPSYGANPRLRQYAQSTYSTAMLTDGFLSTSPEYIAAQIYFSQNTAAQYIWIGRQDLTAIQTMTVDAGGASWYAGDQFVVTQSGASYGYGQVVTVTTGAAVTVSIVANQQGTGYAVGTNLVCTAVSPSTGTGLTVNITAVGETLLQSAEACRAINSTWYGLTVNAPTDADNLALSAWADAAWQTTRYTPFSSDASIPAGTTGNLALQLKALNLRVLGIYATTQSGLYPNNVYAAVAVMGVEMGLNTGLAGSFFTTAYKQLVGIATEPLSQTQYTTICNSNFNAYVDAAPYQFFQPGFMSNGAPAYLWLNLAVLVANLQIDVLNVLASTNVVTQTNSDQHLLLEGANTACANSVSIGFLAGATWTGKTVLDLATGAPLPLGYLNQSQAYTKQSSGDRAAGKAMPIYCTVTTAGAVQSLVIGVYTQL